MKRFTVSLWTAAVAALLLAGSVHAAPPGWHYNWTPSTTTIISDDSDPMDLPNASKIILTNESNKQAFGNSDVTATNISVESSAPPGFPDEFSTTGDVSFALRITDDASGIFKDFVFTGTFNTQDPMNPSTVSDGNANVKYKPTHDLTPVVEVIGDNEYTITYNGYTPPPPEGASNKGSISYNIKVRELNIQKAPEPSSMLLAGMGASFLGFGAWRKRRQQAGEKA